MELLPAAASQQLLRRFASFSFYFIPKTIISTNSQHHKSEIDAAFQFSGMNHWKY
jgi:hypothetical protein